MPNSQTKDSIAIMVIALATPFAILLIGYSIFKHYAPIYVSFLTHYHTWWWYAPAIAGTIIALYGAYGFCKALLATFFME